MKIYEELIWGFQQEFAIGVNGFAQQVFDAIDPNLDAQAFIVGIQPPNNSEDNWLSFIYPSDDLYEAKSFLGFEECFKLVSISGPEGGFIDPRGQNRYFWEQRNFRKWLAIKSADLLNESYPDRHFRGSHPFCINGFWVFVVLHFDRVAFDLHYSLKQNEWTDGHISGTVSTSFLNSVVEVFLDECFSEIQKENPGFSPGIGRLKEDIYRDAGRLLMDNPRRRLGNQLQHASVALFDFFTVLATLPYESSAAKGGFYLTNYDRSGVDINVEFSKPIPLSESRTARKLLEITADAHNLLTTPDAIYGLGKIDEDYSHENENVFEVKILKHNTWQLTHSGSVLMFVKDGVPSLPRVSINREDFVSQVRRVWDNETEVDENKLWEITDSAKDQRHGTLLIISSEAEKESKRLEEQSTKINPILLDSGIVRKISSIDGAILVDPLGRCFAIGVILDGYVVPGGDRGRGARFNSAMRYVEMRQNKAMAIIISEDGMIDILPKFVPQLCVSKLHQRLKELEELSNEVDPSQTRFRRCKRWFEEHKNYLSEKNCVRVNSLTETIVSKIRGQHPATQYEATHFIVNPEYEEVNLKDC